MNASAVWNQARLGPGGPVVLLMAGLVLLPRIFAARHPSEVGLDAPDFDLALVANAGALGDGKADKTSLSLSELHGSAVLLDFWATWCAPCRAEAPIVDQVSRRWRDKGLVVVGVNVDSAQGNPREFAMRNGLTYPIVRDIDGEASRLFAVESLPTLVVVSRSGKVTAVRRGMTTDAELDRLVRQAL